MKLFAYYAIHSFVNTIKKLFKTWLIIIIIAMVFGAAVGVIASAAASKSGNAEEVTVEEVSETVEEENGNFLTERGIETPVFVDFIISLVFIALLVMNVLGASKSGKMFKPGDVIMLFASPLKPQSVLLFRLMGTIGLSLILSLYMLFQIPNFVINLHMTVWSVIVLVIAYAFTLIQGTLFQVTFYTLSSRDGKKAGDYNRLVLIVLGVIALSFAIYVSGTGVDLLTGGVNFFAGKKTFFVPFWGWTRAMCYYAICGDNVNSAIYMAVMLVATVVLIVVIWSIKCDFYEDAIEAAEKQAALLESARESTKGGVQARTKERKGKVNRGGFAHGWGASVFFFKPLYNRFRFSKLKIFSITSIVYMAITALASWGFTQASLDNAFTYIACIIGGCVFYRTLGNPLEEDINKAFFVMVPEKAGKKLLYSIGAGLTITLMDIFIPIVGAAVYFKANPVHVLLWILFALSIDFFGTCTGAFIAVSVPGEAGKGAKLITQIIFLYFGLIPSAIMVVLGFVFSVLVIALLGGIALNAALGYLFYALMPRFLENGNM